MRSRCCKKLEEYIRVKVIDIIIGKDFDFFSEPEIGF